MNLITIAQRYWKPLLILNGILFASTIAIAQFSPRSWTASIQVILPDTTSNLDASLGTLGNLKGTSINFSNEVNPLKTQASIITSQDVLRPVWASDPEKSLYQSLNSYKKLFKVTPVDQSTTIRMEVKGSHPDLALKRAATLVNVYQQRLNELRKDEAVARAQFSSSELKRASQNLIQRQRALAAFKESSGLTNSEEQTKGIVSVISTLTEAQAQALAQAESNETLAKTLSNRIGLTPDQAIKSLGLGANQDYQFTRQKLSEVEASLVQARARFTNSNPAVQSLISQRNQLRYQIEQYVAQASANTVGVDTTAGSRDSDGRAELMQRLILAESEGRMQRFQAVQLQSQVDKLSKTLSAIPANQAQVLELQRQYDIAEGVYKGLIAQVQQAKVSAFDSYPNVQILDLPTVDPKPTSPKRSLIALGGILASVFGSIGLVLFLESRNPLLKLKDLQEMEFPVLARIPHLKQPIAKLDRESETEVELQRLASAISLMPLENRRLMVSSSTFAEGKTTVTLGLAMALIDLGFRVLVVDGDFRKAELSQRLGYSKQAVSNSSLRPIQVRPGLDLMPTLPRKNGRIVEFVARGDFERTLSAIQSSSNYDYVIVDTAPVGLTSESALMAATVFNVLFVLRPGISDRYEVQETLEQLTRYNARIVGLVINGLETRTEGYIYRRASYQVDS
jgi:uncharacterized protein involved in exopolysaccharide biosynthesis